MNLFPELILSVFLFQDRETLETELNRVLMMLNSQTEYIDRWVDFFFTHTVNVQHVTRMINTSVTHQTKINRRYLLFWLQFENRLDKTRKGKWHGSGQYHSRLCRNSRVQRIFQLSRAGVKSMSLILIRLKLVLLTGLPKPWKRQEPFEKRQSVSGKST